MLFQKNYSDVGISRTLDIIEFVGLPPILENRIKGCHRNHVFSHSPYQIFSIETKHFHIAHINFFM